MPGGAVPPAPCSGFVGGTEWLHQGPEQTDMKCRTSVQSEEQGVGPLSYDQLQESPPCAAWAPAEAHSLGHAEWAA